MAQKTICHSLLEAKIRSSEIPAVCYNTFGEWINVSWKEYYHKVEQIAGALLSLGIKPGDKIAIFSNTRLEWALADMASMAIGAVTVPIYASNIGEDISFILNDSQSKLIFCENQQIYSRWKDIKNTCPTVETTIIMDSSSDGKGKSITMSDLYKTGEEYFQKDRDFLRGHIEKVKISDLATIVYTSGTTGRPKGVMLTHQQIMSEILDIYPALGISDKDVSLTFLPFAHIFGRLEHWGHVCMGFTMGYAESIDKIRNNLSTIKPTFLVAVPRIFEKIYNGIITQAEASPTKYKIFKWAVAVGKEVSQHKINKTQIPIPLLIQYRLAKKMVFDKLSEKMGGRLRVTFSGGAPLSKEIAEFFHAANLLILEGYGLTETTAGVTVNSPFDYKFGTVGKPVGDSVIKIADDGEILVKSKKVMVGYYNRPEATEEVLKDGWFYTGDIGEFTPDGFLRITDRKKDLIKTSGGKYVAPQKLENLLKLSKYVSNILIHGDQKKYIVALLTLDVANIQEYAKEHSISCSTKKDLMGHPKIKELMRSVVAEVNSQLASYESIKNFAILPEDFTIETGELTPSLKVRRKFCDKKFESVINTLYGVEPARS